MILGMPDKNNSKKHDIGKLAIILVVIVILGALLFKKPAITGKVISEESIFSENLNLQLNESGTYEWEVKNPGKIKSLKATGSVSANGTTRVYIEKDGARQLLFDSTRQLFDIDIHVLPEYKSILQGDEILIQIELLNLRGFGAGDINVEYAIKDSKGNLIAAEEEIIFIETLAKFVRKLVIPAEIKPSTYVAFVEASINGTIVGSGSDTFEVKSKYKISPYQQLKYYIIGLAAFVALIIIAIFTVHSYKSLKKKKKLVELKEKTPLEKVEKLEKELKALESAYKSGFISEESYKKDKERIERELKKRSFK